ncbi:hypothetical protein BDW66DRAFT_138186 [Aspergillus desertorum]
MERISGPKRQRTSLNPRIRELVISRVVILNGALFEWEQHSPLLSQTGLSDTASGCWGRERRYRARVAEGVLSAAEGVVLTYTDAITKTVTVPKRRDLMSERSLRSQQLLLLITV